MISPWQVVAVAVASLAATALAALSVGGAPSRLVRTNRAGQKVPAVLGLALVGAAVLGALAAGALGGRDAPLRLTEAAATAAAAVLLVVGLLDDLAGGGPRGFREHLGSLRRLRPSTGVLKLAAGVGAGVAVALVDGGGPVRVVAATVLLAVCTNLWNALDVAPGRAVKFGLLVLVVVVPVAWRAGEGLLAGAALGAAAGILPFDLLARGMLGDAGSNPLGFLVGVALALVLPTWGVAVAAALGLALQVAAETVTISRLIEAVPPLRWFDRLGRRD